MIHHKYHVSSKKHYGTFLTHNYENVSSLVNIPLFIHSSVYLLFVLFTWFCLCRKFVNIKFTKIYFQKQIQRCRKQRNIISEILINCWKSTNCRTESFDPHVNFSVFLVSMKLYRGSSFLPQVPERITTAVCLTGLNFPESFAHAGSVQSHLH